jgi:hypothetical protein
MPRLEIDIAVDDRPATGGRADGVNDVAGDGPHVSGTLLGPDGRVSAFVGWVGLLALLQQVVAEHVVAKPAPDPSSTPGTR